MIFNHSAVFDDAERAFIVPHYGVDFMTLGGAVKIYSLAVIDIVERHGIGITTVAREGEHAVRAVFEYFFCLPLGQFALSAPHFSEHIISPCGLVEKFAKSIL